MCVCCLHGGHFAWVWEGRSRCRHCEYKIAGRRRKIRPASQSTIQSAWPLSRRLHFSVPVLSHLPSYLFSMFSANLPSSSPHSRIPSRKTCLCYEALDCVRTVRPLPRSHAMHAAGLRYLIDGSLLLFPVTSAAREGEVALREATNNDDEENVAAGQACRDGLFRPRAG